jgi:hypothetical protein
LQVLYGGGIGALNEALFFYAYSVEACAVEGAYVGGITFKYIPYAGEGL